MRPSVALKSLWPRLPRAAIALVILSVLSARPGSGGALAGPGVQDRLYVTAQDRLLVIDPASLQIVKTVTVPGGMGPAAVATADGRRLFVGNSALESVMVIDTGTDQVTEVVRVGINPVGPMLLAPDGRTVWAMSEEAVSVIDAATHRLLAQIPVDDGVSGGMTFAPAGAGWRAYVSNPKEGTVLAVDGETFRVVARIPVGTRPWRGVVYSKLSGKVYVANTGSQDLSVIDVATNTVRKTVPLPRRGFNNIAITHDGRFLFLDSRYSREGGDSQIVVDASNDSVVATLDVRPAGTASPANPSRLVFTPDNRLGISIHKTSPNVTIIDVATLKILKTIELRPLSDKVLYRCSVTLSPDGSTAYVTSAVEETITVIDVGTLRVRAIVMTHAPTCGMLYVRRQ
jgi:YVTN family beta-propeller protein